MFPLSTVNKSKTKHKPWMTQALIIQCKRKNKLYKQSLLNKSIKSLEKYKLNTNKLTHHREEYSNNRFLAVKYDLRRTWKEIKSVIHETNNFDILPPRKGF